jgi:YggT family protein
MEIQKLIYALAQVYMWLIFGRVILSWVNPRPTNEFLLMIVRVTEPVLAPIRSMIPIKGVDLSPIVVFLLLRVLMAFLLRT